MCLITRVYGIVQWEGNLKTYSYKTYVWQVDRFSHKVMIVSEKFVVLFYESYVYAFVTYQLYHNMALEH